jgi:hypothetical protein
MYKTYEEKGKGVPLHNGTFLYIKGSLSFYRVSSFQMKGTFYT